MVAPIVGSNLQRIGRKNSILIGYTLCMLATLGFGLISLIPQGEKTCYINDKGKEKCYREGDYE